MQASRHENNFDVLRLLAASQVVYDHTTEWMHLSGVRGIPLQIIYMFPGVAVFFILSGFLVTQSFLDCDGNVLDFGVRRALRILPGLWTHYAVLLVLLAIGGSLTLAGLFSARFAGWLAAAMLLGSDYYGFILSGDPFNFQTGSFKHFPSGVLWTISVELGFYVLVPFVLTRAVRRSGLGTVAVMFWAAASLTCGIVLSHYRDDLPALMSSTLVCSPLPFFWVFLIGALLQVNWRRVSPWLIGKAWFWLPLYIAASWADGHFRGVYILNYQNPDVCVVARILLAGLALISTSYTLPQISRVLRGIDISYPVYLYHMPIIHTLLLLGYAKGDPLIWPLVIGPLLVLSLASWVLVEKPALRQKRSVAGRLERLLQVPRGRWPTPAPDSRWLINGATAVVWLAVVAFVALFSNYASKQTTAGVLPAQPVFAISETAASDSPVFEVIGGGHISVNGSGVVLVGDITNYGLQLRTRPIIANAGGDYLLRYDIRLGGGIMGLAVIDDETGQWLKTVTAIQKPEGALRFQTRAKRLRVVLFNSNATPCETTAHIARIDLFAVAS